MPQSELNPKSKYFLNEIDSYIKNTPKSYQKQIEKNIKKGESIEWVFLQFFDHAKLGYQIDSQARKLLNINLEGFVLDDFEVDLFKKYFWLHYTRRDMSKSLVDRIDFTLKEGLADIFYEKILNKKYNKTNVKEVLEKTKDEIDFVNYNELKYIDDNDYPIIELEITDELDNLPNVSEISKQFKKILELVKSN